MTQPADLSQWRVKIRQPGAPPVKGDPRQVWADPVNRVVLSLGNALRKAAFEEGIDLSTARVAISNLGGKDFVITYSLLPPGPGYPDTVSRPKKATAPMVKHPCAHCHTALLTDQEVVCPTCKGLLCMFCGDDDCGSVKINRLRQ